MEKPDIICQLNKCTGCGACLNSCRADAISMQEMECGHIYPVINYEKCIACGKCVDTCPSNKILKTVTPMKTYAAFAKDEYEYKTSTSGGVAAVFTNYMLNSGGAVYGASFNGKFRHIRIVEPDKAYLLKGSKYVHSHLEDSLKNIKRDLQKGKNVLFIGMPCQVAAVKSFLGDTLRDNLVAVDMICHGVPSQEMLFNHLYDAYGVSLADVENISFRDCKGFNLKIDCKNGKSIYKSECDDLYYMAFNDNLGYRSSCYECPYASSGRVGDITIGDFWGLGKKKAFEAPLKYGVSCVLVNSEKGADFLDKTKESLNLYERELEEAIEGNSQLRNSAISKNNSKFVRLYSKFKIEKALRSCLRVRRLKSIILKVLQRLKNNR